MACIPHHVILMLLSTFFLIILQTIWLFPEGGEEHKHAKPAMAGNELNRAQFCTSKPTSTPDLSDYSAVLVPDSSSEPHLQMNAQSKLVVQEEKQQKWPGLLSVMQSLKQATIQTYCLSQVKRSSLFISTQAQIRIIQQQILLTSVSSWSLFPWPLTLTA